jgi:hypothetical protein
MSAIPITTALASTSASNKSPSKQMYSFSKSARFPEPKFLGCHKTAYTIPSTNSGKSTTFGHGSRFGNTFGNKSSDGKMNVLML